MVTTAMCLFPVASICGRSWPRGGVDRHPPSSCVLDPMRCPADPRPAGTDPRPRRGPAPRLVPGHERPAPDARSGRRRWRCRRRRRHVLAERHAGRSAVTARPCDVVASTVWLCRPGQTPDPCASSRAATAVAGERHHPPRVIADLAPSAGRFDCFYVYPTVSTEPGVNADLAVQPAEQAAAVVQASRFSQHCTVWAPMYRQVTVTGLAAASRPVRRWLSRTPACWPPGRTISPTTTTAGRSSSSGIRRARPCSSSCCRPRSTPRRACAGRMVSAILLGGNVQVPTGRAVGGTFRTHPGLRHGPSQTRCVIAYSSFGSPPPANSLFGRAGRRGEPPLGPGRRRLAAGGVRQSRHVLLPGRASCSPSSGAPRRRTTGRAGADALGDLPRPLHGTVPAERWRIVVAGDGHPGRRRPPPDRLGLLGPALGVPPGRRQPGPGQSRGRRRRSRRRPTADSTGSRRNSPWEKLPGRP